MLSRDTIVFMQPSQESNKVTLDNTRPMDIFYKGGFLGLSLSLKMILVSSANRLAKFFPRYGYSIVTVNSLLISNNSRNIHRQHEVLLRPWSPGRCRLPPPPPSPTSALTPATRPSLTAKASLTPTWLLALPSMPAVSGTTHMSILATLSPPPAPRVLPPIPALQPWPPSPAPTPVSRPATQPRASAKATSTTTDLLVLPSTLLAWVTTPTAVLVTSSPLLAPRVPPPTLPLPWPPARLPWAPSLLAPTPVFRTATRPSLIAKSSSMPTRLNAVPTLLPALDIAPTVPLATLSLLPAPGVLPLLLAAMLLLLLVLQTVSSLPLLCLLLVLPPFSRWLATRLAVRSKLCLVGDVWND